MNLRERFKSYISKEALFHQKDRLLLAVSGGVDSVVLCELCKQASFSFAIAHCNFQLRGEESVEDESFVRSVAAAYGVPFFSRRFETALYAERNKLSIQVAARVLRYTWFNELAAGKQDNDDANHPLVTGNPLYDYILTAHHADDNVETILMNFFKGTGITGLRGILPKQGKLVRPLLFCHKDELHDFANEQKLRFREDESNNTDKYTRNYFRNQLIPSMEKLFPSVRMNLAENSKRFAAIETLYMQAIALNKKKLIETKGKEIHIPVLKLKKLPAAEAILYEIIKDFGFTTHQVKDVYRLLESESGRYVASPGFRVIRNRNWLIIAPQPGGDSELYIIEEDTKSITFSEGKLEFKSADSDGMQITGGEETAVLDAKELQFPMLLRKWKQGDYFYPLGLRKKKKISRFLIDQKMSVLEKEQVWVLETNKKIVWVIGKRIDDRFKLIPSTKSALRIKFTPSG